MGKKTHYCQQWKVDSDYKKKLSKEERDFLNQFEDEYYRQSFDPNKEQLHSKEQKKELCNNYNKSFNDVVTKSGDQVGAHLSKEVSKTHKPRYYQPSDYNFQGDESQNPEDALIEMIDSAK